MKYKDFLHLSLKVVLITAFFVGVFQLWTFVFPKEETQKDTAQNAEIYQSAYSANLGNVGVALSTRIGIAYNNGSGVSRNSFYREITDIGTTPEEKRSLRAEMISQNMLIIGEYLNLSRTNIKAMLDSAPDRRKTLEGFISQLEIRYKNSAMSIESLQKQKELLLADLTRIDGKISQVKSSMESHFSQNQASTTLEDVDTYFILREEYTESFTDIVFINQFLKQHAFLNNYNKGILDTLINNKEAIINQSYVVIPDSGDQYLRPLDLIFDEAEIKAKKKTED